MTTEAETPPLDMVWRDGALHPANLFWARKAAEQLGEGEVVSVVTREQRSKQSHNHYFAVIAKGWENIPPLMEPEFRNPEALRKKALIVKGHCNSHQTVCPSPRDAQRMAAFIRPMDEYSIVSVKGCVLTRYTAKSQAKDFADKGQFQKSKQDVIDFIADLIGVTSNELADASGYRAGRPGTLVEAA